MARKSRSACPKPGKGRSLRSMDIGAEKLDAPIGGLGGLRVSVSCSGSTGGSGVIGFAVITVLRVTILRQSGPLEGVRSQPRSPKAVNGYIYEHVHVNDHEFQVDVDLDILVHADGL
jgi:hypothetical protein